MFDRSDTVTSARLDRIIAKLESAPARRCEAPLRVIAALARQLGDLAPDADDALGRRRHRTAAARLARTAVDAAAGLHGTVGARPDLAVAHTVAAGDAAARARSDQSLPAPASALGACAQLALDLPPLSEEQDWQLAAIAFADEAALRDLRDALVVLAATALRAAAG